MQGSIKLRARGSTTTTQVQWFTHLFPHFMFIWKRIYLQAMSDINDHQVCSSFIYWKYKEMEATSRMALAGWLLWNEKGIKENRVSSKRYIRDLQLTSHGSQTSSHPACKLGEKFGQNNCSFACDLFCMWLWKTCRHMCMHAWCLDCFKTQN